MLLEIESVLQREKVREIRDELEEEIKMGESTMCVIIYINCRWWSES